MPSACWAATCRAGTTKRNMDGSGYLDEIGSRDCYCSVGWQARNGGFRQGLRESESAHIHDLRSRDCRHLRILPGRCTGIRALLRRQHYGDVGDRLHQLPLLWEGMPLRLQCRGVILVQAGEPSLDFDKVSPHLALCGSGLARAAALGGTGTALPVLMVASIPSCSLPCHGVRGRTGAFQGRRLLQLLARLRSGTIAAE